MSRLNRKDHRKVRGCLRSAGQAWVSPPRSAKDAATLPKHEALAQIIMIDPRAMGIDVVAIAQDATFTKWIRARDLKIFQLHGFKLANFAACQRASGTKVENPMV